MKISRHWRRHAFRNNPKAQYTFKSLLVHGILQFTMLITLRCALHRCSSRDIRRWKLCFKERWSNERPPKETTFRHNVFYTEIAIASQQRRINPMLLHYPRTKAPERDSTLKRERAPTPAQKLTKKFTVKWLDMCVNDPSAGSPTETLLRLLLPLSDKVH